MQQTNFSSDMVSPSPVEEALETCGQCGAASALGSNGKCSSCNETLEWRYDDLAKQYGWLDCERVHAMHSINLDYGDENVIPLRNGRELRSSAYPHACDYVRVVQDGHELAYWSSDEWQLDPEVVMGAILGACSVGTTG